MVSKFYRLSVSQAFMVLSTIIPVTKIIAMVIHIFRVILTLRTLLKLIKSGGMGLDLCIGGSGGLGCKAILDYILS